MCFSPFPFLVRKSIDDILILAIKLDKISAKFEIRVGEI